MRNVGTGKRAAGTKAGPDHIHGSPGKLVIGPDIELRFFALGWRLVREKTDLGLFFRQIWSEFCFGPLRQLPGVLLSPPTGQSAVLHQQNLQALHRVVVG